MSKYARMPWSRNHKCEQPSRMVFLDTETYASHDQSEPTLEKHFLRLGVASLWTRGKHGWKKREQINFHDCAGFWQWFYGLLRKGKPTWVYAHNAAFDTTILGLWGEIDRGNQRILEYLDSSGQRTDNISASKRVWRSKLALDGIPFIVECRSDYGPIKYVDTLNYWNVPLRKLGKYVGIPKLEFDPFASDQSLVYTYCENDVAIIEKAVVSLMEYWKANDLGNWQPTLASLSYSSFRHSKEKCTIVSHGDYSNDEEIRAFGCIVGATDSMSAKDVTDCERRSYFGGRTECFYIGDVIHGAVAGTDNSPTLYSSCRPVIGGPITVFDVNSMYPFIMKQYKHPFELMDAIRFPQLSTALRLIEEFWCCADVELDTDEAEYPKKQGEYTHYPVGRFRTTLAGCELQRAAAGNCIRAAVNLCVYYSGSPFTSFIDSWHERRKAAINSGREVEQRFCNDVMRSLYGKLAQKTPPWKTDGTSIPPLRWGTYFGSNPECHLPCIMRSIGGVSQYKAEQRSCRHTFVAAAASVTAGARYYMQTLISHCPPNSIVYMDTDSLFTLPAATEALRALSLVHPTELGKLKEKGVYNHVRIWGPKDYELDGVRTIAGLSSNNVEISERVWNQVTFEGIRSIIQHDPDGFCNFREVRFSPCLNLHNRSVEWNGWTKPIRVS